MKTIHLPFFALLALLIFSLMSPASALSGGVARREISPPIGGAMYGYAARGKEVSTGVHDPLLARTLVLRGETGHLVLIAMDVGSFPNDSMQRVRERVKQETGLENLCFSVSHSHSSGLFQRDFPSEDAPWAREVESKIVDAIKEAATVLAPVQVGAGWGRLEEGHNRRLVGEDGTVTMLWTNNERIPTQPLDYAVGVIQIQKEDGEPMATLVNFTCHPVVLGPDNLSISADYPGAMARRVEETIGGQCLFLQGACGDINPFGDKTPVTEGGFEEMQRMGHALAEEVLRVSGEIQAYSKDLDLSYHRDEAGLTPRRAQEPDQIVEAEIHTIVMGDSIALATFPGEFFVEHALSLKNRSKFDYTFFIGYSNGALGYFPTINACVEGGYGADTMTSRFEPGSAEELVNRALINLYRQSGKLR